MINFFTYQNLVKTFIFCFITLIVMNSIKSFQIVEFIGMYGKLAIILISILVFTPFLNRTGYSVKLKNNWAYLLIYILLVFFSIINVFHENKIGNLIYNLTLFFYVFYYFFMTKILWGVYFKEKKSKSYQHTKIEIFKVFRIALFWNLIFWFFLSFIANVDFSDDLGEFGGFFQDKIHFGLYATTGFLVCFYMRFNDIEKDNSKLNLLQIILYAFFAFISSRNALLIVVVAPLYYFVVYNVKNYLYALLLIISPLFIFYFDEIVYGVSVDRLNSLSSGRLEIWRIALVEVFQKGIFNGSGLFNLNDIVLKNNIGTGFHYLDTLEFLYFHSSIVELLAGGGVLVLLLFFWILFKSWNSLTRIEKAIMSAILIGGTVESYLTQPFMLISVLFYFILMMNNSQMRVAKLTIKA
ncbi:O-antigen ligase family protein [Maribacter sp. Asnod2-G09]|uniref:O-antigen ligase family protein n=1 Tax=Maribacter sp. Asnod2-G09 TaxID=3160577 RepID=UPI003867CC2E